VGELAEAGSLRGIATSVHVLYMYRAVVLSTSSPVLARVNTTPHLSTEFLLTVFLMRRGLLVVLLLPILEARPTRRLGTWRP
jgi:hypothetical protein